MGLLKTLFGTEMRGRNSGDDFWYAPIMAWSPTASGVRVDSDSAMRSAAVAACVRVLSESVASLPLHVYKRRADGGKQRATEHPLYILLHDEPNQYMTAYQWLETAMAHLTLTGNHYSEIYFTGRGEVSELIPLNPSRIEVKTKKSGGIEYEEKMPDGKTRIIPAEKMLHIPGMGWDGISGMSPITYARETIGLSLAAEETGARFYGNGMNPGHIITLPEGVRFDDEQTTKFMEDLREKYSGLGKSYRVLTLPNGMNIEPVSISPEDAQYIEGRRFQVEEIARIYRVPLHMIGENTKSTSWGTGIESMTLGFVTYTLRPWLTRIEQTLERRLMRPGDRRTHFVEFLVADLLRGDQKARSEYYTAAIQNGWMNRNEVRIIENMNPVDGGDDFLVPLNMSVAGEQPEEEPPQSPEDEDVRSSCGSHHNHVAQPIDRRADGLTRQRIQRSFIRVIADAIDRVIRRERNDVLRAAEGMFNKRGITKRSVQEFVEWLGEYYFGLREFTVTQIRPSFVALGEAVGSEAMAELQRIFEMNEELDAWMDAYIENFGARHSNRQLQELEALVRTTSEEGGDMVQTITNRFDQWYGTDTEDPRSMIDGRNESVRLGQGFSRQVFTQAGVDTFVWTTTGEETCPMCTHLDGRVTTSDRNFMEEGDAIGDFRPNSTIAHPPLHLGCDCIITPGV